MRLEALRQEHPGKNDEPWLFLLLGCHLGCWGVFSLDVFFVGFLEVFGYEENSKERYSRHDDVVSRLGVDSFCISVVFSVIVHVHCFFLFHFCVTS